jgi:hypothetical protein
LTNGAPGVPLTYPAGSAYASTKWNGGGIHGVQPASTGFQRLKAKYGGRIVAGRTDKALEYHTALTHLLEEMPVAAPSGLTVAEFKEIAGPPTGETPKKLSYWFEDGRLGPGIVIEIIGGKIGKFQFVPGE